MNVSGPGSGAPLYRTGVRADPQSISQTGGEGGRWPEGPGGTRRYRGKRCGEGRGDAGMVVAEQSSAALPGTRCAAIVIAGAGSPPRCVPSRDAEAARSSLRGGALCQTKSA